MNSFCQKYNSGVIMQQNQGPAEPIPTEDPNDFLDDNFFHYGQIKCFQNIPPNIIDDGVSQSLFREFSSMAFRFSYVLCPRSKGADKLKNWDLWGPFFMCCILGIIINDATQFLVLFAVIFGGAIVVTFNTRILGGKISVFQSVSILGYCIFPLFFGMVMLKVLGMVGYKHILIKIFIMLVGALWGVLAASVFITSNVEDSKKSVALYPVLLFYMFVALLALYM